MGAGARECAEEAVVFVEGLAGAGGVEGFWHSCMFLDSFLGGWWYHLRSFLFRYFPVLSLFAFFLRSFTPLPSLFPPPFFPHSPPDPPLVVPPPFYPSLLPLPLNPPLLPPRNPSSLHSYTPPSSPFSPTHKLTTTPGSRANFAIASAFLTQLLLTASTEAEGAEMSNLVARWRWAMRMGSEGNDNRGGLMEMGLGVGFGGLGLGIEGEGGGGYEE